MKGAAKEEEKKNLQIKDCPLSMNAWITILSSEINRIQEMISHSLSVFFASIAVVAAIAYGSLAILKDILLRWGVYLRVGEHFSTILFLSVLFLLSVFLFDNYKFGKMIKTLEPIREDAIAGILDSNETYKRWREEYIKLTKKKLGLFN